ncbi:MAG: hypothetical protein M1835_002259 [Candelina submexicana]|nr:MAG: hypothetical protein M1835_002259 [Candelina submexicana]
MENQVHSGPDTPANPCNVDLFSVAQNPVNPGMEFDEFGVPSASAKRVGRDDPGKQAQPDRNGRRFLSPIFSVLVGSDKIMMTAHKEVLCQSPVLRCMCTGPFVESSAKTLILSEDDPALIGVLLEYLYSGTYDPQHSDLLTTTTTTTTTNNDNNNAKSSDRMEEATELYLLADKYALPHLQHLIVCKLNRGEISYTSESFFASAKRIFTVLPLTITTPITTIITSGPFFVFFRDKAVGLLNPLVVSSDWFAELFDEGGAFAVELGRFMGQMITCPYLMERDANQKAMEGEVKLGEVRAQMRREMRTATNAALRAGKVGK